MSAAHRFTRVTFTHFKAFKKFALNLRHFNILVGPNNAGKSTILAAFRILAAAMRKATTRNAEIVRGPNGETLGHRVDLSSISVAEENIFYNYDDSEAAAVSFTLSNNNELLLYFAERGHCSLIARGGSSCTTPGRFKSQFTCPIGFAPILGPVDHNEQLYDKEAARRALFNYSASRNFRNIWHHYPERFDEFRETLQRTWPGMDIQRPTVEYGLQKPTLFMFCPEERIPREIFWAGFGFQVWCQMLTHLIQSRDKALFLIDEPDIYLHSDLQRQLLGLLRNLGPDIVIATHSTEIITEAEPDDIVVVDKRRDTARRLRNPSQLGSVFSLLGSNLNPILTQLAKTRRAVFVEGRDFQILGKFAQRLNVSKVSSRANFAVIPVEGFNPERIRSLITGIEATLGTPILAAAILDRDFRSDAERQALVADCRAFCGHVIIHKRKEIENFLLVPAAIDRAAEKRLDDRARRTGERLRYSLKARDVLDQYAADKKEYVVAQHLAQRRHFERARNPAIHEATTSEETLRDFNRWWQDPDLRMTLVPGKDALSYFNGELQEACSISVTSSAIIDAMHTDDVPADMRKLVNELDAFGIEPVES